MLEESKKEELMNTLVNELATAIGHLTASSKYQRIFIEHQQQQIQDLKQQLADATSTDYAVGG